MQIRIWMPLVILGLTGCSTPEGSQRERFVPARPVTNIVSETVVGTAEGAWVAVQMPFEDIGFKKQPIPERLQKIADHPYAMPRSILCDDLKKEISELDAVLGPDVCTFENPTGVPPQRKGEYIEDGAGLAREQAVGIVRSQVDVIPLRGVVRHISGAEKHAKAVERAYEAGRLRRAFLKGLVVSLGPECVNPLIGNKTIFQP